MSPEDQAILSRFFTQSLQEELSQQNSSERIKSLASNFLGSPYVGGTLETAGEERLQVNLRAFDCLTLVESVLALNTCIIQTDQLDSCLSIYPQALKNIRYRNGNMEGYISRLHYTSEWLLNGQEKGIIRIETDLFAGEPFPLDVHYMSEHPEQYPALTEDASLIEEIAIVEAGINKASMRYIPKAKLFEYLDDIPDGSIIAITTDIKGLDIAHIGLAYRKNQRLHLLHASSTARQVIVSEQDLFSYLMDKAHFTGIMIAQVNK